MGESNPWNKHTYLTEETMEVIWAYGENLETLVLPISGDLGIT